MKNVCKQAKWILMGMALAIVCAFVLGVHYALPVAAAEPEQTYDIHSAEEFEAYSRAYASGQRNPKDVLNISINSGSVVTDAGFVSLGTAARPFAGTIVIPTAGVDTFHLFNCPLFDYVSTDMVLSGAGVVKIVREAAPESPASGTLTQGALFANHVVKGTADATWSVSLTPYSGDGQSATEYACVLGDVAADCNVTLTYTNTTDLSVRAAADAGLLCGSLGAGATLVASTAGSGGAISVTSTAGNAGGLVGTLASGATLQYNTANNSRVTSVSAARYAGGLVGSATEADVAAGTGVTDYTVSGSVTGTLASGGLFGYYKKTGPMGLSMADYTIASGMNMSGSGYTGGVVGLLDNAGGAFDFDGNASTDTISVTLSGGSSRGGIVGGYTTNALTDSLIIHNTTVRVNASTTAANANATSAGLIGSVCNVAAYISIYGVSATSTGSLDAGLIGDLGNGGAWADVSGTVSVSGTANAGLVGKMDEGVLRIAGTTDLGGYSQVDWTSGYIVRDRDRALVYALGNGQGGNWTLRRNLSNSLDDVHTWGEVVRTDGTILAESDLFAVDATAHTVTLKAAAATMNNVTQFALTALNIQLNTKAAVGALRFTSGSANASATLLAGTLTIGADISLAGTGLTGLTRDDGDNAAFSGTLTGGDHTLTLAIGERYGLNSSGGALSADSKQGNIYRHTHNGLLAKTAGATLQNVQLAGEMVIYQSENELYAGGLVAEASGALTLTDVVCAFTLTYKVSGDYTFYFGGAIGAATGNSLDVEASDSRFAPTVNDVTETSITRGKVSWMGGVIGGVLAGSATSPAQAVSIEDCTLTFNYTKSINSNRESAFGAAIAQVGNAQYVKARRTVSITDTTLAITATGKAAANRFGGILGTEWLAADVTIDGLTISSATITATGSATPYGGLVQTATGAWDLQSISLTAATFSLPNNGSSFGFVANKTYVNGTYKSALYLEVTDAGYDIGALSFAGTPNFGYYDEIVANSVATGANVTQNGNSVVSVTTSGNALDTTGSTYDTYLNKTAYGRTVSAVNSHARYYYNVAYARTQTATAKYDFFVWSLKQYAHTSLSAWFVPTGNSFTGDLDMTGISYYPVDLSGSLTLSNATIKLDNVLMEAAVHYAYRYTDGSLLTSTARTTRTNDNQHYLMHTALLCNMTGTLNLSTVTLQGNVPNLSLSHCGFVVAGTVGGADNVRAKCNFSAVTCDGVYISNGDSHLTSTTYAPLCINAVGKNSTVDWAGAAQTSAYSGYAAAGYYAASSLVGDVGDPTARAIYLTLTAMVFDSRTTTVSIDNMDACYGTAKSIFSRATLLNSLRYFAESTGSYNFEITEDRTGVSTATHRVTYGKEISTSVENADEQKKYYGSEYYVHPTAYQSSSPYDFSTGFLPYVYVSYNLGEYRHELSVNVTFSSVIEGCGKYGDPFIVDDDDKLSIISQIIAGVDVGNTVQFYLPDDLTSYDYTGTAYTEYLYNFGTTNCTSSNGGASMGIANVRRYMAGAYIVITRDVTLDSDYVALGTADSAQYAFRGVIVGSGNPTVTNQSREPLIRSSMGCVVKGLTVEVAVDYNSTDTIELAAPTGSNTYAYSSGIQAYGAVIGQILGGDTFIDAVQVEFTSVTFSITVANVSTNFPRLTPIGGYVGALVNGGLIFRNMTSANVGLTASVCSWVNNAGYLYVNPIIGRVIAGYAFYEGATYRATEEDCTLKNGQKNYTIADLSPAAGKLGVTYSSSNYNISVPDGQALYVLGAIVNSGAGTAAYSNSTINAYDDLTAFWSAYRAHTMARAGASYSAVGESGFASASDYTDYATLDTYTDTGAKIPYIVRAYTLKSGSVYLARCITTANANRITITGNCDVAAGFRGIGSLYYNSELLRLRISKCSGKIGSTEAGYLVTLHMRYLEYNHKSVSAYIAVAENNSVETTAGFGLFNVLQMRSASATNSVQYLQLAGSVFYDVYTIDGVPAQYAFANYANGSKYDRPENGSITGTDSEDVTQRRTILSVGGVAGLTRSAFYIKNVTFANLDVEGAKSAGGMIGFAYHGGASAVSYIAYDTTSVTNTGYVNVVGGLQAGGLIGRIYRAAIQIDGATGGTDVILKNVELKMADPNETGMYYPANLTTGVGGLVGTCWAADGDSNETPSLDPESTIKVRRLFITNINVVKGTDTANVLVLYDSGSKNNYAGGIVGSAHNVWLQLNNCRVQNVNVSANVAGGFIGKISQKYFLYIQRCVAEGTDKTHAISGTSYAGGIVGWAIGRDSIYFQMLDCAVQNYTVQSTTTAALQAGAGGIVGMAQGDNVAVTANSNYVCEFNNLTVYNCDIKTNYAAAADQYRTGTGGVIGVIGTTGESTNTNNKYKLSGYNILVKNCTFAHKDGGSTDKSTAATNRRIGDIVGNNTVQTPLKLVGVSVQNATYCGKHVGYYNSDADNYGSSSSSSFAAGYLVLANYHGVTTGTSFAEVQDEDTAADDFVDVTAASPYVTANPSITIGGMTLTGDGVAASVATLPIQNIIADGTSGRYGYAASAYYTGNSGDNNLTAFTAFGNKFVLFSSEVSGYLGTDFAVLVVDDTNRDNSHRLINSYLRLLTNTTHDFGADSTGVYGVTIYNVTFEDDAFTASATGASLRRVDGRFYMSNTLFDSGKTQFSLIDVRFYDPADNSKTAYHLYVPVFVKKVLSYRFDVAVQSGTTYLDDVYSDKYGQALIENVGTPVTVYFQYLYSRTAAEWTDAINAGENVNRNYAKSLLLYKANTNEQLNAFPADTVLVLVDPNQGGRAYYATVGTAVVGNTLSLSAFRSVLTKSGGVISLSGDTFAPRSLGEMLSLSVTTVGDGTDRLVTCAANAATVVVGSQGYRLATDAELADGSIAKYTVTAAVSNLVENYYLSVFTQSNAVNDLLFHYYLITTPSSFAEVDYPSKISDTGAHTMVHLVMGKIFHHAALTIESSSELGPEVMTVDNNELSVTFSTQLGLSTGLDEEIKSNLRSLIRGSSVYHSYLVYLNRNDGTQTIKAIIGEPTGSGHYLLDGITGAVQTDYAAANIHVTQNHAEFVSGNLNDAFASGNNFVIRATVTLSYESAALLSQFPGRGPTTPDNGVTVSGSSNIAFAASATTYSKNTVAGDETPAVTYYSEAEPEVATLDLNPIGDKVGDFTPLGINALNIDNATQAEFELLAVLDVSSVTEAVADYAQVALSVKLDVKNDAGGYDAVADVTDYLTLSVAGVAAADIHADGATLSTVLARSHSGLSDNGAEITLPNLQFAVKTGNALENAGLKYANYRITVYVWLKDDSGVDYTVSHADNYVIYTNAKLLPDYIG